MKKYIRKHTAKAEDMIRQIIILAAVIAIVHGQCGENESLEIGGCDAHCDDLDNCDIELGLKCYCKDEHARNSENKCVPKASCCTKENEEYQNPGSEATCDDTVLKPPLKKGCFCKKYFYRNEAGFCVPENECPDDTPVCDGPNEVYISSTTQPDVTCDSTCYIPKDGCYCADGYARNLNGICVLKNLCSPCEDPNEVYLTEKEAPLCEGTCSTQGLPCDNTVPRAGCYCGARFTRDLNGKCVNLLTCKDMCTGPNEVFLPQGKAPGCDTYCDQDPHKCCRCKHHPNSAGCYCINNYSRNKWGICIPTEFCSCKEKKKD